MENLTGTADFAYNGYTTAPGPDFEDLNGFVNADGKLPFNSEWVFKLSGSVDLPWRMLLSGFYQYRTGEYWTPYAVIEGLYFNDRTDVYMESLGTRQLDDRHLLDVHLEKAFPLSGKLDLSVMFDVFNVLNSDTVLEVQDRWGTYYYDYTNHPDGSEWVQSSAFGAPLRVENGREVRLSDFVGARHVLLALNRGFS